MSKKFPEYKGLDLPKVAEDITRFWDENAIFDKSMDEREGAEPFIFFEGPPSANGMPGIHHVMARSIKDIFCRYKTQKGFQVKRKAGWDTHGLPVELKVEKELGISKEDIGTKISIEDYNNACKEAVMRYTDVWNDLTKKIGYWVDMENPYITYKSKYMESVWWLLSEIYKKGLIYKGYTIQPYSPKAGTGLSSHELNQPGTYQDVSDTTVTAQFKAIKNSLPEQLQTVEGDIFFLAWTTTPWTLPSNTALTIGKKIEYVVVKTFNQYTFEPINVIFAKNLVKNLLGKKYFESEDLYEFLIDSSTVPKKTKDNEHIYDILKSVTKNSGDLDQLTDTIDLVNSLKKLPYTIVAEIKGESLIEARYEQLMKFALPYHSPKDAFRVIAGDFVTTEDGTGIVHTAPTFGADDAMVCKQAKPEVPGLLVKDDNDNLVPLVDLKGRFRPEAGHLAGKYVKNEYYEDGEAPEKSVDVEIAIQLKEQNRAFLVEKYVHSYPNCWRTDKPILYYPLDSWFIKVTEFKDRMHELNKSINWKPAATGEGRFGNWLANANDWNLSRSRYWGIPLPIWRTEDGKEEIIIGSIKELKAEIQKAVNAGVMDEDPFASFEVDNLSEENYEKVDLHKNTVDQITLVSSTGQPMKREADLIDVWFDSGSMPYAQWHYPFENKEKVEDTWRSADFIAEGVDQTRGWFYTLHAIGTMIFDDVAYKNVVSNGLVLDKNGQKMSKRLGNAADPFITLDTYGPDATRWYMISNANPWDNLKFDLEGIGEVQRKFFGTLYNTYSFFSMYANLDQFQYKEQDIDSKERPEIDRWILSELNTLIQTVDEFYANYEPTKATRAISEFVQENMSNWYVRLSRRRFWKGDYKTDKISAYQTLFTCLKTIAQLSAPVAPFFSDRLYKDLTSTSLGDHKESVHLANFPKQNPELIDKDLEHKMQMAQSISSLALSLRKKEMIKVRQPLERIMIPVLDPTVKEKIAEVSDLIKSEINVKTIEFIDDTSGILVKDIKPNFKVLGPRFGKEMKHVAQAIQNMDAKDIAELEKNKHIELKVNGEPTEIRLEEVEILSQDIEGWLVASGNGLTVALDVTLNEDLVNEGIARELVNRIQNLRKDSGLEVTDRIDIHLQESGKLSEAVHQNLGYIKTETLTNTINLTPKVKDGLQIEFDDIQTVLAIEKLN
ncbi:isoleucine--tRNA ligase [Psychroflexus sediminis]|uniref:Isoleucine--tRNA ligase n=1 Tax=Psychroflexus sediminis TaxID=470826 RepID=A0A1G7TU59_9FLAO|nr:isoleucine--tRNA ligase [Psychroflexus sediminis]SDG38773.1 Isoleucyl-tRNA synthetase [Psychroflexus sediminis]